MWNKSQVVLVKVRTKAEGRSHGKVRFTLPLSLFALQECLDAWGPLAGLLGLAGIRLGKDVDNGWMRMGGRYLSLGSEFLRELRSYGRMDIVDVQTRDGDAVKIALY
jgi:hypothetical protein